MPWSDVLACLKSGEGSQVEFLPSIITTEDLLRHCITFLNESGGRVIVGIDDKNSHLLGSNVSRHFVETTLQKIIPPTPFNIEEIQRGNRTVLLITMPNGKEKPYTTGRNKIYLKNIKHAGEKLPQKWNTRQMSVLDYLKSHATITNRDFRDQHSVSHKTAHIELTTLLNAKLIIKVGQGRNTAYQLVQGPAIT